MAPRIVSGIQRFTGLYWAKEIADPVNQVKNTNNNPLNMADKGKDSKIVITRRIVTVYFRRLFLNLRLFDTTETELKAMAAPANIGFKRNPVKG